MRIEVVATDFPRHTEWHHRRVLKWFSQRDLEGLEFNGVLGECSDDSQLTKMPPYLRGFLDPDIISFRGSSK
jgi:hypothetical protein